MGNRMKYPSEIAEGGVPHPDLTLYSTFTKRNGTEEPARTR